MSMCPLCNFLRSPGERCQCGALMEDSGPVTDYYGPYSPYYNLEFESPFCRHLFTCPECGCDRVVAVPLIKS